MLEHQEGYVEAISAIVPPNIMEEAVQIVKAHRPVGIPESGEPTALANILIVEDNDWMGKLYQTTAEGAENKAVIASSAEEAKEIIKREKIDRIVIDIDGLEDDWLKVYNAGNKKSIKTVIVSGDLGVVAAAEAAGVEVLFKKPDKKSARQIRELFSKK